MKVIHRRARHHVAVEALMQREVVKVDESEPLSSVVRHMRERSVSAVVVMSDNRLTGILTERDVMRAIVEDADLEGVVARDYMTPDVLTVSRGEDAVAAAAAMIERGVRHVPVVEGGEPVGMLSARNMLHLEDARRHIWERYAEPW